MEKNIVTYWYQHRHSAKNIGILPKIQYHVTLVHFSCIWNIDIKNSNIASEILCYVSTETKADWRPDFFIACKSDVFQAWWYWHSDCGRERALWGDQGEATGASGKPNYTLQVGGICMNNNHVLNWCHTGLLRVQVKIQSVAFTGTAFHLDGQRER